MSKRETLSESHRANISRGVRASLAKKGFGPPQPAGALPCEVCDEPTNRQYSICEACERELRTALAEPVARVLRGPDAQPADNAEVCVDYEVDPNTGEVFTVTKCAQPVDVAGVLERIWIDAIDCRDDRASGVYYAGRPSIASIEYVRATQSATAPSDLITRDAAMRAICSRCANPDRYSPPVPVEGSQRLFHFQIADNWNAGQCDAQAIKELSSLTTCDAVQHARAIRLPFPCGCLDRYSAKGMTVEEYTCEMHRAIAAAIQCATPPDVTERARRATSKFAKLSHWMNETERTADIIAAEFAEGRISSAFPVSSSVLIPYLVEVVRLLGSRFRQ